MIDDVTLRRIRIDQPPDMAAKLDAHARQRGVTRQELIKVWLGDRLEQVASVLKDQPRQRSSAAS